MLGPRRRRGYGENYPFSEEDRDRKCTTPLRKKQGLRLDRDEAKPVQRLHDGEPARPAIVAPCLVDCCRLPDKLRRAAFHVQAGPRDGGGFLVILVVGVDLPEVVPRAFGDLLCRENT